MDKTRLFEFLSAQDAPFLLDLLSTAYDQMAPDQRRRVFGKLIEELPPAPVDGEESEVVDIDPQAASDKKMTSRNDLLSDRRVELYGKLLQK